MPYPIKSSQTVDSLQAATITFRPLAAGLINVVVVAQAIIPPPPPQHSGEIDPPPLAALDFRLDVFAPGAATPAFTKSYAQLLEGQTPDRAILVGDVMASDDQISGEWTVKVTNTNSKLNESFDITVRYPVMGGNLGKIDHIFVVMMENRSFDHMLGYLKSAGRTDVDGIDPVPAVNYDENNAPCPAQVLTNTNFVTDPGHGWTDVAGTMPGSAPSTVPYQLQADGPLTSLGGFVKNFQNQIAASNPLPPHDYTTLPPGGTRTIEFRPANIPKGASTITIGVRSVPVAPIPTQSHSGNLGQLSLASPGNPNVVPVAVAPIGSGAISLQYDVSAADEALTGNWTCQLTNDTDMTLDFVTDVSNCIGTTDPTGVEPPGNIMGYYDKNGVPVYDFLASQFTICDRWFAPIPTDTFPNRLYAMTGGSGGMLTTPTDASVASDPPAYTEKTIFEILQEQGIDWNIFFSDLPFGLMFKTLAQDAQYTARMQPITEFVERAKTGDLPAMAWIDPNYNDVPDGTDNANDDHPPGDVARGQQFIGQIYNALVNSPAWSRSLLVITYDEHGGFHDHVLPPGTPTDSAGHVIVGNPAAGGPKDDNPALQRYGLRVPAIIVSPWVPAATCSHVVYDHTSILRTILLRFCGKAPQLLPEAAPDNSTQAQSPHLLQGAVGGNPLGDTYPSMGARTDNATALEGELSLDAPRTATSIGTAAAAMAALTPKAGTQSPVAGIGATLRLGVLGF